MNDDVRRNARLGAFAGFSESYAQTGLTKREEFAKAALQGLLTNGDTALRYELAARYAVGHADALLEELAK